MREIVFDSFRVSVATSVLDRSRGVIGREHIIDNGGLLITRCNCVHSFFVNSILSLYFLREDFSVCREFTLNPNNISPIVFNAAHVLECSSLIPVYSIYDVLHQIQVLDRSDPLL